MSQSPPKRKVDEEEVTFVRSTPPKSADADVDADEALAARSTSKLMQIRGRRAADAGERRQEAFEQEAAQDRRALRRPRRAQEAAYGPV